MDIDAVAMKVKVVLEGLDEAASAINSFMQQMKAASDSVTAVIQAGANQGKAAVQEAAQEMAASTETNSTRYRGPIQRYRGRFLVSESSSLDRA